MSIVFKKSKNDKIYIDFEIKNIYISLANGIRRILLNDIPIVSFDTKNIKINLNNTSLHNEFLSHRISLVPIDNHLFKFKSFYDFSKKKRIYEFIDEPDTFTLKEKNNYNYNDPNNYNIITSNNFKLNDKIANEYFKPDPFFDDEKDKNKNKEYVLITYLKVTKKIQEEIDIQCKPSIGFSNDNAIYNPTGTVVYHNIKEDDDIIKSKLKEYIIYIQNERKEKGIEEYSKEEIESKKEDFMILDSDRIIKEKEFYFKIESVGNLYSYELLYNSIIIYQLKLVDLLQNISYINNKLIFYKLISIKNDDNNYIINIKNENHTLGNVINEYIYNNYNKLYIDTCSYKNIHPLKEEIVISINLKNEILEKIPNKLFYLDDEYNIKYVDDNQNYIIYMFQYSIINILSDLNQLKNQIGNNYNLSKTNFDIDFYDNIKNIINISQ